MDNHEQIVTILLSSSLMKFSAGHFTIFSANARETIHGHNFKVECLLESKIKENDLVFDYEIFKKNLYSFVHSLMKSYYFPKTRHIW
ncbi:6-carboxytetrahydropterin synthase [Legionella fairfieldensis]|uniref:6-carboxytetrahydropterin synthase n=1 Tax=Legionella fairfieldensis TaxID=45064 RepID=UPI000685995F|nr:6-carboxytetrahydropterin synthase [Legionella fairfieldensis]